MSSYKFFFYTKEALEYQASFHAFALAPDYDFTADRYQILIADDPSAGAQYATVRDMDGKTITQGALEPPRYDELRGPNGSVYIDYIEVNGTLYGYAASQEMTPGTPYPIIASATGHSGASYRATDSVPCFCEGTFIETDQGPRPIEEIETGHRVVTLDHGCQPVLWVGRFTASPLQISRDIGLCPITLPPGSIGTDSPNRALSLSGDHRILLSDYEIELYFGEDYALAPARNITNEAQQTISSLSPLTFYHLLFAEHEIISANGLWCESLFPSQQALSRLSTTDQWHIDNLIGHTLGTQRTAHRTLEHWECTVLTARTSAQFDAASLHQSQYQQTA